MDHTYHIEQLSHFPPSTWFAPTNGGEHDYFSICAELSEVGMIERRDTPVERDGRIVGSRVEFRYDEKIVTNH